MQAHVNITFDFNDPELSGFAALTRLVQALQGIGIDTAVQVTGIDASPAPRSRRVRGGNGAVAKPVAALAPVAADSLGDALGTEGDEDPLDGELSAGGLSPTEALERALAGARQIYNHGFRKEIQTLQRECGVTKFADVPADKGHEFLARVLRLAEQTGVHV